ncbi:carbohydrate binding-domain-containing protein [Clohesyomyces aquaticus]|uniref:Carbohydrate binding-domain-containing protein n=1 Tax=Clohesyomyces aquaticus TaxID=1231657 RepID=A0A1Y1ZIL3_9PLEO|nr:carbohydrate binding-domain-containing protein [Clohesyomyces aquaticus]
MKLFLLAPLVALAAAEDLQWCAATNQQYYPSKYTCFPTMLCPKNNGEVYLACGKSCYSTHTYFCDQNNQLQIYNPTNEPILQCGSKPFYPSKYACYDGNFLCPILGGNPTLRCGEACYNPAEYSCKDGKLGPPFH